MATNDDNPLVLLTDELLSALPEIFSQEGDPDPIVYAKFFAPDSIWTWFICEGRMEIFEDEGEFDYDFLFCGYTIGHSNGWGCFYLSGLEETEGPWGLRIERDLHFEPAPWSEVKKREQINEGQPSA
ncbi:MAG TPA: DUF2958 domain-containing protein [Blastocatellia bacterium]|nr:DUF2958 domain-containing protein [Blastocatellia bacterium]